MFQVGLFCQIVLPLLPNCEYNCQNCKCTCDYEHPLADGVRVVQNSGVGYILADIVDVEGDIIGVDGCSFGSVRTGI